MYTLNRQKQSSILNHASKTSLIPLKKTIGRYSYYEHVTCCWGNRDLYADEWASYLNSIFYFGWFEYPYTNKNRGHL